MGSHIQAGAETQYSPGVLGNVGLEKRDLHRVAGLDSGPCRQALYSCRVSMKFLNEST
jgi:hypothetical protein